MTFAGILHNRNFLILQLLIKIMDVSEPSCIWFD